MTALSYNSVGAVLLLDHEDIDIVFQLIDAGVDAAPKLADKGVPPWLVAVIIVYLKAQRWLIVQVNQGFGVYLTIPWPAVWYNQWWIIIPTTRPRVGPPTNWAQIGIGQFRTEDSADLMEFQIQPNAVSPDVVEFQLETNNAGMWRKVLVMPDGEGNQWDIVIDPSQGVLSASNGVWAGQVKNGQHLQIWKAKTFGIMHWVLNIGDLQDLPPGARVVFRWLRD